MIDQRAYGVAACRRVGRVSACWCLAFVFLSLHNSTSAAESLSGPVAARIFGEPFLADNVATIRQRAALLPETERFQFLVQWVLPGPSHPAFRMSGEFSPTRPLPTTNSQAEIQAVVGEQLGDEIVSPVFNLLDLAARTGRTEELLKLVAALDESPGSLPKRSRPSLLVLLHLELKDAAAAEQALGRLEEIAAKDTPTAMYDQWPETLVAYRCVKRFPEFDPVSDLLSMLLSKRLQKGIPAVDPAWFVQMWSIDRESEYQKLSQWNKVVSARPASEKSLRNWIPVARELASTCGRGFPQASWLWDGQECQHLGGHDDDYLFFRSPLRGDFSVEADLRGFNTTQVLTAGSVFGPHAPINMITGTFRSGAIVKPVDPPFHRTDKWIRYRTVVRNGVHETWLHGRLVNTRKSSGTRPGRRTDGRLPSKATLKTLSSKWPSHPLMVRQKVSE